MNNPPRPRRRDRAKRHTETTLVEEIMMGFIFIGFFFALLVFLSFV